MVAKKSPEANLEKKKCLYVLLGFVMVLSLVYIVFEWSQKDLPTYDRNQYLSNFVDDIVLPPPTTQTPPPPPPPRPVEEFKIVEKPTTTENVALKSEDSPTEGVEQPTNVKYEVTPEAIEEIHNFVEEMPQFKGDIMLFLSKNIKYPALAQELGLQGKVICQFVVDRNGAIENVEVVRGIDKSLDNEAVRVIKSMPNWKPGRMNGRTVKVKYTLPIYFRLM